MEGLKAPDTLLGSTPIMKIAKTHEAANKTGIVTEKKPLHLKIATKHPIKIETLNIEYII